MPTAPSVFEYPPIVDAIRVPLTMAGLMTALSPSGDALLATLGNGVRVVAIPLPHLESASVSVFVHSGSASESRKESGISHFVEHMAFKGTTGRSCQQINLDAEQLGADVNAHTDKDHTAFHMRGMARDAGDFVRMLGDIVLNSQLSRGRARARAPGAAAGVHRGRGGSALDRVQAVRPALASAAIPPACR